MGGMVIRISALGQRCVVLRLFWKDGRRRPDLPICINHADVTAAFVIVATANVKKKIFVCIFFLALQVWVLVVVAWVCLRRQLFNQSLLSENKPHKAKTPNLPSWRSISQTYPSAQWADLTRWALWTQATGSWRSDQIDCQRKKERKMNWMEIPLHGWLHQCSHFLLEIKKKQQKKNNPPVAKKWHESTS